MWICLHSILHSELQKEATVRYGLRGSFKVIEINSTDRKHVCDFLIVLHCNCVPIFHRFGDHNDILVENGDFFYILPVFNGPVQKDPVRILPRFYTCGKTRIMELRGFEILTID